MNQLDRFYDTKSKRLIMHTSMTTDMIDMFAADLSNPFRRDYILNMPLIESSFADMIPHLGELIYMQSIDK